MSAGVRVTTAWLEPAQPAAHRASTVQMSEPCR